MKMKSNEIDYYILTFPDEVQILKPAKSEK